MTTRRKPSAGAAPVKSPRSPRPLTPSAMATLREIKESGEVHKLAFDYNQIKILQDRGLVETFKKDASNARPGNKRAAKVSFIRLTAGGVALLKERVTAHVDG